MTINRTLIESTKKLISRKEVKSRYKYDLDPIPIIRKYQIIRQLNKLIGIVKNLMKGQNNKIKDIFLWWIKNLQEIGNVKIESWDENTELENWIEYAKIIRNEWKHKTLTKEKSLRQNNLQKQ